MGVWKKDIGGNIDKVEMHCKNGYFSVYTNTGTKEECYNLDRILMADLTKTLMEEIFGIYPTPDVERKNELFWKFLYESQITKREFGCGLNFEDFVIENKKDFTKIIEEYETKKIVEKIGGQK